MSLLEPTPSEAPAFSSFAELERIALECTRCPLASTRTQVVFGAGDPGADLMFVGEGPGEQEDLEGIPFVGRAGRLLTGLIEGIGLDRDAVYIANVVKCRPPGNRDPEPFEITTCTDLYLWKQIEAISPKLIVTLGRHSMGLFLPPEMRISQVHGQPKRIRGRVVLPLYHPAAALYNGSMRQTLMYDFKKIPLVLKKLAAA